MVFETVEFFFGKKTFMSYNKQLDSICYEKMYETERRSFFVREKNKNIVRKFSLLFLVQRKDEE